MKAEKQKISFEEALAGLEKSAEMLKSDNTTLEEALHNFEQGIQYYHYCNDILNHAKQQIEFYEKKNLKGDESDGE